MAVPTTRPTAALPFAMPSVLPARTEDPPFVGIRACGIAVFAFTPGVYNNGFEDLPIRQIRKEGDGSWTPVMPDGYRVTPSGVTHTERGWFSPESGDGFDCRGVRG